MECGKYQKLAIVVRRRINAVNDHRIGLVHTTTITRIELLD
jgi:hypothetical protein